MTTTQKSSRGVGRPRLTDAPPRPADAVPPAQYDRMRGPTWTQRQAPAARAGAEDFKRIPSRGFSC